MIIKNNQLSRLISILSGLKLPKSLTIDYITSVVTIAAQLKPLQDKYIEASKLIFDSYDIKLVDGGYNWAGNEHEAEITAKLNTLAESANPINVTLPNDEDLYAKISQDLIIDDLVFLKEILVN